MRNCIRCGAEHKGVYGGRCEDCWALAQRAVFSADSHGVPNVSGFRESTPNNRQVDPDIAAIANGAETWRGKWTPERAAVAVVQ